MTKFAPDTLSTIISGLKRLNPWVEHTGYGDEPIQLAKLLCSPCGPASEKVRFEQRLATKGRFSAGREAWNGWAQEMLDLRQIAGPESPLTIVCDALAIADFSGFRFDDHADFTTFVFPGRTSFAGVEFEKQAWFHSCVFQGEAVFEQTSFVAGGVFENSAFHGPADFSNTVWMGAAEFRGVEMNGRADFSHTEFRAPAWFVGARFEAADFSGARFGDEAAFTRARRACCMRLHKSDSTSGMYSSLAFSERKRQ